jgi:hypothetical protein
MVPMVVGTISVALLIWWESVTAEPMLPLRLFRNATYNACVFASSIANLVFTCLVVLIPIDYQLVGLPANEAGIRLIPLTVAGAGASFIIGNLVARFGRAAIFPQIGAALMTAMSVVMALFGIGHSLAADVFMTLCLGSTLGFQFNPVNVLVQNSLAPADNGIGITSQMFFRLMAAAFGVAILTSLLIAYLSSGALAVPGHEVLGPEPGFALLHLDLNDGSLDPALLAGLAETVRSAFAKIFWILSGLGLLAFATALTLRDTELRGYATVDKTLADEAD